MGEDVGCGAGLLEWVAGCVRCGVDGDAADVAGAGRDGGALDVVTLDGGAAERGTVLLGRCAPVPEDVHPATVRATRTGTRNLGLIMLGCANPSRLCA